jgi:dipeptide/tripeptide permease
MPVIAIVFGALLIGLGFVGANQPDLLGKPAEKKELTPEESEKKPPFNTAYIPAFVGGLLALCGVGSLAVAGMRKHLMHLAAMLGLLGTIGGLVPMMRSQFDFEKSSTISGLLMTGLCLLFVVLCVRSFIAARKARTAASAA